MSTKPYKDVLQKAEKYIESGNYKEASIIIESIDTSDMSEDDKKRYANLNSILKPDKMYIIVSLGVIVMAIIYFILVK